MEARGDLMGGGEVSCCRSVSRPGREKELNLPDNTQMTLAR